MRVVWVLYLLLFAQTSICQSNSANWSDLLDKKASLIALINRNFGDSYTYVGTRVVNDYQHVLLLKDESVQRSGQLIEALFWQFNFEETEMNGVYMFTLCDCANARFKITALQEVVSGSPDEVLLTNDDWSVGIGDSMFGRMTKAICNRLNNDIAGVDLLGEHGVYKLPVTINNVVTEYFIFDTGASDILISNEVAIKLSAQGTLGQEHYVGEANYTDASGNVLSCRQYILDSVRVGSREVKYVLCAVSNSLDSPMLLGQSFMRKIGRYEFDYSSNRLILK